MKLWMLIILSSVVTVSTRVLPLFVKGFDRIPKFLRKMMAFLPLASLGALIFPFAFMDFSYAMISCGVSLLSAFIVGYMKKPMLVSIFVSLGILTLMLWAGGVC